jgi:hypothetical protein
VRADAETNALGLPMHDAHTAVVDAERLGTDLRHRGLEALTDRGAAGHHFHVAPLVHRDECIVRRTLAALLKKQCYAGAHNVAGRAPRL